MTYRFLFDTNILSDLVRVPQGRVAKCIEREGERTVCTSIIVAEELRFVPESWVPSGCPGNLK